MARLYLDEDIGSRLLVQLLGEAGHRVTYCRDLGYRNVSDDFHLYAASQRGEVLISFDRDYLSLHGALLRLASDHAIVDFLSGVLLLPQENMSDHDIARYVDAFFAAELLIANCLYVFREAGSWVEHHPREYP
jgi:predicted nuclease of predicted toxin-antitoxin system